MKSTSAFLLVFFFVFLSSLPMAAGDHAEESGEKQVQEREGQDRAEAENIDDPRKKKGDRYFKSFESLEGGKSENPSFDVGFPGEKEGSIHRCAATLIKKNPASRKKKDSKKEGDSCSAAIAAHCVEESFGKTVNMKTGYGDFSATVMAHPEYEKAQKNAKKEKTNNPDGSDKVQVTYRPEDKPIDVAVLKITGKLCQQAPKVPLCAEPPTKGKKLMMASSWMGKLMSGGVAPGSSAGAPENNHTVDTLLGADFGVSFANYTSSNEKGITQGDSGGGGFMKTEGGAEGSLCIFGVLSAKTDTPPANPPLPPDFSRNAIYAGGKKVLDFIRQKAD